MSATPSRLALLSLLGACQAPASSSSGFASTPEITTAPAGSSSDTGVNSTGSSAGSTSTTTGSTGSTSGESGVGETTTQPVLDVGTVPDLGGGSPVGCKGKIDLLFVISNNYLMEEVQLELINAFPEFIETIESKFDDFDYHIMVVDGDDDWGAEVCDEDCPVFDCKIGDPCCGTNPTPENVGKLCCPVQDYPCDYVAKVTKCDAAIGAGTVFPAGLYASNKQCPIDGGRRYMVKGQKNLSDTFACVAQVGVSGGSKLGEALTAAVQQNINDPGGCNPGFLRKDALLMATLIDVNPEEGGGGLSSEGFAWDWNKALLDAKHDPASVVLFYIGNPDWKKYDDQILELMTMFPYGFVTPWWDPDYGAAFETASGLVETACAGFVVPG